MVHFKRNFRIFRPIVSILGDLDLEPSEPTEEHINLHHSLKEVHDSAIKAVKDIGGYIHQEVTAVAKKHFNTISRPLVRLMVPILYFKDQLDTLIGVNKPTQEQDIAAWCPTCDQVHSESLPCDHKPDSIFPDESHYVNIDITTPNPVELTSPPKTHESVPADSVNNSEYSQIKPQSQNPVIVDEPDIVLPDDFEYQTKLVHTPEDGNEVTGTIAVESEIDIRLGNENKPTEKIIKNFKSIFENEY